MRRDEKELPPLLSPRAHRPREVSKITCKEAALPVLMNCTRQGLFIPASGEE